MIRIFVFFLIPLILVGCHREDFSVSSEIFDFEPRVQTLASSENSKKISQLSSNDVVVAVNGCVLRKRVYDDLMAMKAKNLRDSQKVDSMVLQKMMDAHRRSYVKNFVAQRLLWDEAFRLGVVTTNEVLRAVERSVLKFSEKRGKTPQAIVSAYRENKRYFLNELAVAYVMDRIIEKKIPPSARVDEKFVRAVRDQINADNAAAEETNKLYAARLRDYRQQMIAGKLDFRTVSALMAGQNPTNANAGVWGEFEEGEMDNPTVQAQVFALPLNGISDVVEEDNGFRLVKVLAIKPAETNEEGTVISRERRTVSDIYIEKLPVMLTQTDIALTHDLKRQMQLQAVNRFVTGLSTNGLHRIVYPYGKNLFD